MPQIPSIGPIRPPNLFSREEDYGYRSPYLDRFPNLPVRKKNETVIRPPTFWEKIWDPIREGVDSLAENPILANLTPIGMIQEDLNRVGPSKDQLEQVQDWVTSGRWSEAPTVPTLESGNLLGMLSPRGIKPGWTPKGTVQGPITRSDAIGEQLAKWTNQRAAAPIEGEIQRRAFSDVGKNGLQDILDFNAGKQSPEFDRVRDYLTTSRLEYIGRAKKAIGMKENYLPQLWEDAPEDVAKVFGRRLTRSPKFGLESVFKSYEEGIQAGLTPKYQTIPELIEWYATTANKAGADVEMFNWLRDKELIASPNSRLAKGMVPLDPSAVTGVTRKIGKTKIQQVWMADPKVAEFLNNYFDNTKNLWDTVRSGVSKSKELVLSSGVPGTGINFHAFGVGARDIGTSKTPIATALRDAKWALHPDSAQLFLEQHLPETKRLVENGMTTNIEEITGKTKKTPEGVLHKLDWLITGSGPDRIDAPEFWATTVKEFPSRVMDIQRQYFETPLFGKILPAYKTSRALDIVSDLVSKDVPVDEAWKTAAHQVNDIFSGFNSTELGRSKAAKQFTGIVFLAPDWLESQGRLGAGIAKSLLDPSDPRGQIYHTAVKNLLGVMAAANVMNKVSSGKWMWENDENHLFDIAVGKDSDGKTRYLRPFGTSADFLRIPIEVAHAAANGDMGKAMEALNNRLSIPFKTFMKTVNQIDSFGNPISGKDKFGKEIPLSNQVLGNLTNLAEPISPQPIQALSGLAQGNTSLESALSKTIELPISYARSKEEIDAMKRGKGRVGRPTRKRKL